MSPTLALQSPVFLFYVALAVGILAVTGVILAVLKWVLRKNVSHAWTAYSSWLFLVPLLLLIYFLGRETTIVFVTVLALFGFREFALATGLHQDGIITWAVYLGIAVMGTVCW